MNTSKLRRLRLEAKEYIRLIPVREGGGCVLRVGETLVAVYSNVAKARVELIARRAHVCELCEREIGAGDLYYEECRKKDGIFRVKLHISCSKSGDSDRQEFRKKVYEFGSFFDSWEKRLLKAKKAWLSNLTSN